MIAKRSPRAALALAGSMLFFAGISSACSAQSDLVPRWLSVDPRTELVFFGMCHGVDPCASGVLDAKDGTLRAVTQQFVEPTYPPSGVLFAGHSALELYDPNSFALLRSSAPPTFWFPTDLSPDGKWLLGFDVVSSVIVDTATLETRDVPLGYDSDSHWMHGPDSLLTLEVRDDGVAAHLRSWSLATVASQGYATGGGGAWAGADLDITLTDPTDFFYGVEAIRPDDQEIVLGGVDLATRSISRLGVVDVTTGTLRIVEDVHGPCIFSTDGALLACHRGEWDASRLVVLDAESLAPSAESSVTGTLLDGARAPDGRFVALVCDEETGVSQLGDVTNGAWTPAGADLICPVPSEIVKGDAGARFFIHGGALWAVDLDSVTVSLVELPFTPTAVAYLPHARQLVVADEPGGVLRLYDLAAARLTGSFDLGDME